VKQATPAGVTLPAGENLVVLQQWWTPSDGSAGQWRDVPIVAPVVVVPPPPPPVTQVATPTASPLPPGPGTIPLTVKLSCATPGASIYINTAGVKPTYPPTGYTKLYNASTGVVIADAAYNPFCIYAIAVLAGLTTSELATFNYVPAKAKS
jgi:hypothetical protein